MTEEQLSIFRFNNLNENGFKNIPIYMDDVYEIYSELLKTEFSRNHISHVTADISASTLVTKINEVLKERAKCES